MQKAALQHHEACAKAKDPELARFVTSLVYMATFITARQCKFSKEAAKAYGMAAADRALKEPRTIRPSTLWLGLSLSLH